LSRAASGLGKTDAGDAGHKNEQDRRTDYVTGEAFEDTDLHATSMCAPQAVAMTLAQANSRGACGKLAQSVRFVCGADNGAGLKRVCTSSVPFLIAGATITV
jgi:hypothetical protein